MSDKEKPRKKRELSEVQEVSVLLKATQQYLFKINKYQDSDKLKQLIQILKPYKNLTLNDIDNALKIGVKSKNIKQNIDYIKVKDITFEQIQDSNIRKTLSREELALVAQKELGISKWRLLKLSRSEMDIEIENAIENYQTLNTIAKNASKME
jgi:hypothetical protein